MATLSLTIVPGKALKDGRHKVRIAVAHRSQTRYILTDVIINSTKEWKNGKIVKRDDATYLNTKLLQRLQEVQHTIDDLPYIEGLTCAELVDTILHTRAKKNHTLASAFEEMLEVSTAKETTIHNYRTQFKFITQYIPATTPVKHITPIMVQRFVKQAESRLAAISLQIYMTLLSMIIKFCQTNGYTDFRVSPTVGCVKRTIGVRQNWLSPDEVRKVRDTTSKRNALNRFRDVFMLSYYLGGVNMVDLVRIDFNECKDTLRYIRTKTERRTKVNPYVEFDIPDEAKPLIAKFKGEDGHLHFFNTSMYNQSRDLGHNARAFRDEVGMPELTFYSARKSFAQHAFMLGENESVIDYILGHALGGSGKTTLYAYIKVTPEMATACVRKVCDFIASTKNF